MADYQRLDSVTDFFSGTESKWNSIDVPIPENMVIFTIDTHIMKLGDGTKKFSELPIWIRFDDIGSGGSGIPDILKNPLTPSDDGKIVILGSDKSFVVSSTVLQDVLDAISNALSVNNTQDNDINNLQAKADLIELFDSNDENKLCIIKNGKYSASDYTLDELNMEIINRVEGLLGLHIKDLVFYYDAELKNKASIIESGNSYYAKIVATDENNNTISYSLTCNNSNVTINNYNQTSGIFSININTMSSNIEATFTITCNNGAGSRSKDVNININAPYTLKLTAYGSEDDDMLPYTSSHIVKHNDEYICVIEDDMGMIVSKYDLNLNLIAKKLIVADNDDFYSPNGLFIDYYGNINIFGIKYTNQSNPLFVIKINNNLSAITDVRLFNEKNNENIDILSYTHTLDHKTVLSISFNYNSNNAAIINLNPDSPVLEYIKQFQNNDTNKPIYRIDSIANNLLNNEFYVNFTGSNICSIVHFDSDFNNILNSFELFHNSKRDILISKFFFDIEKNVLIATGLVANSSPNNNASGLILILNPSDLSIIDKKIYYNDNVDIGFIDIRKDDNDDYIIIGTTFYNSIITLKIDSTSLNIISSKIISCSNSIEFGGMVKSPNDSSIIFGGVSSSSISSNGSEYEMILDLKSFPSGTYNGASTDFEFDDISITSDDVTIQTSSVTINNVENTITMSNSGSLGYIYNNEGKIVKDIIY